MWVRVGDDVLLLACPLRRADKIQALIGERLVGGGAAAGEADVTDYRHPPMDYRLDAANSLLFPTLIAALVMIVGICG